MIDKVRRPFIVNGLLSLVTQTRQLAGLFVVCHFLYSTIDGGCKKTKSRRVPGSVSLALSLIYARSVPSEKRLVRTRYPKRIMLFTDTFCINL